MTNSSFEASLTALERSVDPPLVQLQNAAAILNIDFTNLSSLDCLVHETHTISTTQTFAEQWILRWLLKRISTSTRPRTVPVEQPGVLHFNVIAQTWSLLFSVFNRLPNDVCLEILVERQGIQLLGQCLHMELQATDPTKTLRDVSQPGNAPDSEPVDGPSRKKQRLSADAISQPSKADAPATEMLQFYEMILICIVRCGNLLAPRANPASVSTNTPTVAWTANIDDISSILSSSLRAIRASYTMSTIFSNPDNLQDVTDAVLNLWDPHHVLASGAPQSEIDQKFGLSCLAPALEIIEILQTFNNPAPYPGKTKEALEKLIAVHCLVPLRATFLADYASGWKDARIMLWEQIEPFIKFCTQRYYQGHPIGGPILRLGHRREPFAHLLNIALDILPPFDAQKRRLEQLWLNALFTVLSYIVYPGLPQMSLTTTGNIYELHQHDHPVEVEPILIIENMLRTMQRHGIGLTANMAAYFVWSYSTLPDGLSKGRVFTLLLQSNIDVILPKSGLEVAEKCLKKLHRDFTSKMTDSEREVVLHGIAIPMLRGFVRTRDLLAFIDFWKFHVDFECHHYKSDDDSAHKPLKTVWLHEELLAEFEKTFRHYNNVELIEFLIRKMSSCYDVGQWKRGGDGWLSRPFSDHTAWMPILATYLRGAISNPGCLAGMEDKLITLQRLMGVAINNYEHLGFAFRWRAWDLIHSIQNVLPTLTDECADLIWEHSTRSESKHANDGHATAFENDPFPRWYLAENLECFSLALDIAGRFDDVRISEYLKTHIKELAVLLRKLHDRRTTTTRISEDIDIWTGGSDNLNSAKQYVDACLTQILLHADAVLKLSDIPEDMVKVLVSTAADVQYPSDGGTFENSTTKLCRLILTESSLSDHSLILTCLVEDPRAMSIIQRIPVERLPKTAISRLIKNTVDRLCMEDDRIYPQRITSDLGLVVAFNESEKQGNTLKEQFHNWTDIIEHLDRQMVSILANKNSEFGFRVCSATLQEGKRGLEQFMDKLRTVDDRWLLPLVKGMWKWCQTVSGKSKALSKRLLTVVSIHNLHHWLSDHQSQVETVVSKNARSEAQAQYAKVIVDCLTSLASAGVDASTAFRITVMLDILEHIHREYLPIETIKILLSHLMPYYTRLSEDEEVMHLDSLVEGAVTTIGIQIDRLQRHSSNMPAPRIDIESKLRNIYGKRPTNRTGRWESLDFSQTARAVDELVQRSSVPEYADALTLASQSNSQTWLAAGPAGLLLIASIILRVRTEEVLITPNLGSLLAQIACLKTLSRESSPTNLLLRLDNSRLVLESHSAVVSQSTIDTLLGEIYSLLSSTSIDLDLNSSVGDSQGINAAHLYDRICGLIGVLLTRYRRRISDRFNLLLPCLQGLLRCLFYPGHTVAQSRPPHAHQKGHVRFIESLPRWVRDSDKPLPSSSAQALSRMLISIANPTVSAARSSQKRGRSELNDQVQKTRRMAGQYLQYVVVEYCKASLEGQVDPDVKSKLAPGLYAILDSMNRSLMRGMNAAMDPSSRAIFKILYDDWVKFGRWDNS